MANKNMEEQSEFTAIFIKSMMEEQMAIIDPLIDAKYKDPRFPLDINLCTLLAADQGKTSILMKLITLHPSMSYEDRENRRGIHHAAKNGHVECAHVLLRAGAVINCSDKYGKTPLLIACAMGHLEVVRLLVKKCAHINSCRTELGENAMHIAAMTGNLEMMEVLLDHGGNANIPCVALKGGETPLHKAVIADKPEIVDLLCSKGAKLNVRDVYGKYPIHIACERGHMRCLNILIRHGASLEIPDSGGQMPLGVATTENQTEVAKVLIAHGANVHAVDKGGYAALHKASVRSNLSLIEYLVSAGADINVRVQSSQNTPLLLAVSCGRSDSVQKLIDLGADLSVQDAKGHTAMHLVNYKLGGDPPDKVLAALLNGGGRLDIRDSGQLTPLQRSIVVGVTKRSPPTVCIQLLCQAGSWMGPDEFAMGKKSPLFWLAYSGDIKMALYLVRAGWDLRQESWIVLPGKNEEQDRLHQFMIDERKKMQSLLSCCRKVLRSHLCHVWHNREIISSIESLPVPRPLKNFLALKDVDPHDLSTVPGILSV